MSRKRETNIYIKKERKREKMREREFLDAWFNNLICKSHFKDDDQI